MEIFGEAVARKSYECSEAVHIGGFVGEVIACFLHSDVKARIDTQTGIQCCEIEEIEKASLIEREIEKGCSTRCYQGQGIECQNMREDCSALRYCWSLLKDIPSSGRVQNSKFRVHRM